MLNLLSRFIESKFATVLRYLGLFFIGYQAFFNAQYKLLPAIEPHKALRVFIILVFGEIVIMYLDHRKKAKLSQPSL